MSYPGLALGAGVFVVMGFGLGWVVGAQRALAASRPNYPPAPTEFGAPWR